MHQTDRLPHRSRDQDSHMNMPFHHVPVPSPHGGSPSHQHSDIYLLPHHKFRHILQMPPVFLNFRLPHQEFLQSCRLPVLHRPDNHLPVHPRLQSPLPNHHNPDNHSRHSCFPADTHVLFQLFHRSLRQIPYLLPQEEYQSGYQAPQGELLRK